MSMKKKILLLILCINACMAFGNEYPSLVKVKDYPQSDHVFIYRSDYEMDTYEDHTGNFIWFNQDGRLMGYNVDEYNFLKFDGNFNFTEYMTIDRFFCLRCIKNYGKNFLISDIGDCNYLYNDNGECIFKVVLSEMAGKPIRQRFTYYDEKSDILLVKCKKELYSVVHPSTDQEANAANFRNAEETLSLLRGKTSIYKGDLGVDVNNNLTINGNKYEWEESVSGNCNIYIGFDIIYVYKNNKLFSEIHYASKGDNDIVEATTVHPCGDFYVLKYNPDTKLHTLYRIENTWDPEWRAQWYAEHKE